VTQCSTFSKHPSCYCEGWPKEVVGGFGSTIQDELGRYFTDWTWSGTGILGHIPHEVSSSVCDAMLRGCAFGIPHVLEKQTAELLRQVLPDYAESVRFALNGTDAVAGAVRLARAVTKTPYVVTFEDSYHGASADWFLAYQNPGRGHREFLMKWLSRFMHFAGKFEAIAKCDWFHLWPDWLIPITAQWNDVYSLTDALSQRRVAAVIFEVREAPAPEFVEALNNLPDDVLLIADEVVTGFRVARGGACELYGIKPDLACFGKALGSGVPISALVGKEKYMREFDLEYTNEPVFMSYTHGGNALGLAAAKKTLEIIKSTDAIDKIWKIGADLQASFLAGSFLQNIITSVNNQPQRHSFIFEDVDFGSTYLEGRALFTLFQQKMCEQGVLIGPTNCPTIAHEGEPLEKTKEAMPRAFAAVSRAISKGTVEGELEGPVPRPLYSRRT